MVMFLYGSTVKNAKKVCELLLQASHELIVKNVYNLKYDSIRNMTSKIRKSDFSEICRICLEKNEKMSFLYAPDIMKMISACATVDINESDQLPRQLCSKCYNEMEISFHFKQLCEQSDVLLRKIIDEEEMKQPNLDSDDNIDYGTDFESYNTEHNDLADPCRVCGDKSIGTNYGVRTCFTCKVFFRRHSNAINKFVCTHENNCLINVKSRGKCQRCRLQKCFSVGMTKKELTNPKITQVEINHSTVEDCKTEIKDSIEPNKETLTDSFFKIEQESDNKNNYICLVCKAFFSEQLGLTKHMLRHKNLETHRCQFCNKTFSKIITLSRHMKKHDIKPIKCDVCSKTFRLQIQLDRHNIHFHEKIEHKCKKCGRQFNSRQSLRTHAVSHLSFEQFRCSRCDKWFKYETSVLRHVKEMHNESVAKKDVCSICGKEVRALRKHMFYKHSAGPYKCNYCEKTFSWKSSLEFHSKVHTGEERYEFKELCNICGQKLRTITSLRIHMRSHTGERPYKCPTCDKSFKAKTVLKQHLRIHTGEKPFECVICHKKFTHKNNLEVHQIVHSGQRSFQCDFCGHSFGLKASLKAHIKMHGIV